MAAAIPNFTIDDPQDQNENMDITQENGPSQNLRSKVQEMVTDFEKSKSSKRPNTSPLTKNQYKKAKRRIQKIKDLQESLDHLDEEGRDAADKDKAIKNAKQRAEIEKRLKEAREAHTKAEKDNRERLEKERLEKEETR